MDDTKGYLGEYFKGNQSESSFSEDKRRLDWKISRRRLERLEIHDFCTFSMTQYAMDMN